MPRPSFKATDEQKRIVKTMAGLGTPHEDIAVVIGITAKTLRKHFRQELTLGAIEGQCQGRTDIVYDGDLGSRHRGHDLLGEDAYYATRER
jgi:hypothetical protein